MGKKAILIVTGVRKRTEAMTHKYGKSAMFSVTPPSSKMFKQGESAWHGLLDFMFPVSHSM
jgi:hypothetical protein